MHSLETYVKLKLFGCSSLSGSITQDDQTDLLFPFCQSGSRSVSGVTWRQQHGGDRRVGWKWKGLAQLSYLARDTRPWDAPTRWSCCLGNRCCRSFRPSFPPAAPPQTSRIPHVTSAASRPPRSAPPPSSPPLPLGQVSDQPLVTRPHRTCFPRRNIYYVLVLPDREVVPHVLVWLKSLWLSGEAHSFHNTESTVPADWKQFWRALNVFTSQPGRLEDCLKRSKDTFKRSLGRPEKLAIGSN